MTPEQERGWEEFVAVVSRGVFTHGTDDAIRAADAELKRLRADKAKLLEALKSMTQWEPCDCGCPNQRAAVMLKPTHYRAIAIEAINSVEDAA